MQTSIQHKIFFSLPPNIVWEYLTKAELIEQWLMKNDFKPVVGYDFKFTTRALPNFNFDGVVYCKVLEVTPFKKLVYSWKGGPGNNKITLDSIVEWTLHEKDNGTELELNHTGFREADRNMFALMNTGWLKNMQKINELINTAKHGTNNP
ncbi:SRPBCC family protein [Parafilimonas terrae]|uniref:Uncharacterized conserved protein YndB, AHSA1/START domain n=1 Tax=Parafilimonas terrae TaxID=1465490 RepID=A0A1I5Y064_9BACT|nr:SRPBCC domain-containing protein [Parafilimonas terrae]SFQ37544.1 Uncharacterized conserved protein YndB, AHSA1/START domain [Parafilimonas terrae]